MTTLIGIMPSMQQSTVTIPATVKAITGYQAAVVYDTTSGKIVNPTFSPTTGITLGENQSLLDLGSVGAFQHVGMITDGSATTGPGGTVTPPSMSTPATGLPTLTTINFANNSQLQSIGPKAFLGCSNLTTVNLPNSTNTIGTQAFQNCTNLQTINLKGVSYIGDAAFNNAFIAPNSALATQNPVTLDLTSAQFIGVGAFDSSVWTSTSSSSSRATGPVQVLPGTTPDNDQTTITETQNLSKISAVSFAKPLTTLSPYAFNEANIQALNYGNLDKSISTGSSKIAIQSGTFVNASNLKKITLPASCSQFGLDYSYYSGAFARCTSLSSLNFNNFTVNDKPGVDSNGNQTAAPTGFDQITQDTWVQVANIMNALAYFGQQNIVANSTVEAGTPINTQDQINAITYDIKRDPVAEDGTWYKWVNNKTENDPVNGTHMILRGLAEWAAPRNNFNFPINVYPAGSYGYSVEVASSLGSRTDATTPQVTVEYHAGLVQAWVRILILQQIVLII